MKKAAENAADCVEPLPCGDVDLLDTAVLFSVDNIDHNIITIMVKGHFMQWVSLPPLPQESVQTILFHEDRSQT